MVARVTPAGIAVVSLERESILLRLQSLRQGEIDYIDYQKNETRASLWGTLSADLLNDFRKIRREGSRQFRYVLDFQNVSHVEPSGLAMLLQLSSSSQGRNPVQILNCSDKVEEILNKVAVPGTGIVIKRPPSAGPESGQRFFVYMEPNGKGADRVTIFMPAIFDYEGRVEFSMIYQNRPKGTEYVLDFAMTKHLAKSAFGTLLLMYQHVNPDAPSDIRITHCNTKVRSAFEKMDFDKFFRFVEDGEAI
ncbi:HptB-dependent secretion and biofilm anti anti-sigma factor [Gammaproteobacteria bacterium]